MDSTISLISFLLSVITLASAISLPFTDCGAGNVKEISVTQCKSSPCVLKHFQIIQIKAVIVSKIRARSVFTSISGNVRGRDLPFPDDSVDVCAAGKMSPACPVAIGKKYTYTNNFVIQKFIPTTTIVVTYKGLNEKGKVLACAQITVEIRKK